MNLPSNNGNGDDVLLPSEDDMREALSRVVSSEAFNSSPRLQEFLTYIVNETIAGRGSAIKGKSIAADVYGRDLKGSGGQNLVRVEARRLRRCIHEYYADDGADDPWRIFIELGGYTPRFEPVQAGPSLDNAFKDRAVRSVVPTRPLLFAAVVLVGALAIRAGFDVGENEPETTAANDEAIRAAYAERSMQAVQAVNLAEQARGMFFPVFDLKRQEIALEMFRHSISLDPGLHYGYAGAAQVLATLALLSPDDEAAAASLEEAATMAAKAVELDPSDPWALAAKGLVEAVSGNTEDAMSLARIAVEISPQDGHVLDLAGVTSVLSNAPQFAADTSDPQRPRSGVGRFGANNVWGLSQLMLGNYEAVIEAFSAAPANGAPVSAPSLIFLAVAYDHLGVEEDAGRVVGELSETWPDFPARYIVSRIFPNSPGFGDDILARLAKHGYQTD